MVSMDSKGRLAIPAKFRDILLRRYTPAIVVTLDSRKKLLMYPRAVWGRKSRADFEVESGGNESFATVSRICCCTMRRFWVG